MWKAICLCCAVASTLAAAEMRQFEVENVVVEREKLNRDRLSSSAWDIWTTDPEGRRWSEGTVLRIGGPKSDRNPQDPASAMLTCRSDAMSGRIPIITNSAIPSARVPKASAIRLFFIDRRFSGCKGNKAKRPGEKIL